MKVNTNNKIQMLNYMDSVISSPGYFHSFVASKMPSKDDAYGETIHVILQELYDCFVKEMGKKSTNIISIPQVNDIELVNFIMTSEYVKDQSRKIESLIVTENENTPEFKNTGKSKIVGKLMASALRLCYYQRGPQVSANIVTMFDFLPCIEDETRDPRCVWNYMETKNVKVVGWEKDSNMFLTVSDGLQSISMRVVLAFGRIYSGEFKNVYDFMSKMVVEAETRNGILDNPGDETVINLQANDFRQLNKGGSIIEAALSHRSKLAVGDPIAIENNEVYKKWNMQNLGENDILGKGNMKNMEDREFNMKVIGRYDPQWIDIGADIKRKIYEDLDTRGAFPQKLDINEINPLIEIPIRLYQLTGFQVTKSSLGIVNYNALINNVAVVASGMLANRARDARTVATPIGNLKKAMDYYEGTMPITKVSSNHDKYFANYVCAFLFASFGDETNKLFGSNITVEEIIDNLYYERKWQSFDDLKLRDDYDERFKAIMDLSMAYSDHPFMPTNSAWHTTFRNFVMFYIDKFVSYDVEEDETPQMVSPQMVFVKTKSGQREMSIVDAEDLGLDYELAV